MLFQQGILKKKNLDWCWINFTERGYSIINGVVITMIIVFLGSFWILNALYQFEVIEKRSAV